VPIAWHWFMRKGLIIPSDIQLVLRPRLSVALKTTLCYHAHLKTLLVGWFVQAKAYKSSRFNHLTQMRLAEPRMAKGIKAP
jgi:hypothetical protein